MFCKLLGIKFVHRIASDKDVDFRSEIWSRWRIWSYRLGLKISDIILCQNEYQYNALRKKHNDKKLVIVPNPKVISTKLPVRSLTERQYIAWIGNFRWVKNLPALLEIAKKLSNISFKIAGMEMKDIDDLSKRTILELKKQKNIEFVGYLNKSEIPVFLSKAFVLLNTSYYEGFSNTFLEAWMAGTPLVTTINANPDDICNKNKLGKVAIDYSEIPDLIKSIINDNSYNEIAENCRSYIIKNHSPKCIAHDFTNYLNTRNNGI